MLKSLKIAICVASLGGCKTRFAISLASLCSNLVAKPVSPEIDSQTFKIFYEESSILPQSQYNLVQNALAWNATHILFLEDDMSFPPDAFHRLYLRDQPWVACNYLRRSGPPYIPCARKHDGSPLWTYPDSTGVEHAYVTPFGVTLFKPEVFSQVEPPWFAMPWVENPGYFASSDGYFSMMANRAGVIPLIDHDLSKEIEHHGARAFAWRDAWTAE